MTTIPQELVEVVLVDFDPVEDRDSLRAISLTATNFAGPAQRILFRSLDVRAYEVLGWQPTFERALNLFDASPHISPYVKDLTIRLPLKAALQHHNVLERLLPYFSGVRRFILDGVGVSWDDLQPGLQSALSAFLLRSSLEKLHLIHISNLPVAVVTIAAQTTPVLSLRNVFIDRSVEISPVSAGESTPPPLPCLNYLMLSSPHGMQSHLVQELILPSCAANLRRLVVEQSAFSMELLRAIAPTLTDLSLNCTGTRTPFTLPLLPHLVTLELQVAPSWESILPAWLPATLAALSDAAPALHTLTVRIALPVLDAHARKQDLALPGTPGTAAALAAVDAVLYGAVSRCIWELAMAGAKAAAGVPTVANTLLSGMANCADTTHCALVFARFRAAVERNVARMRAEGALEIRYAERMGYVESLP
ncbi:hypothetical protein B0H14DRAFT_2715767 [Mycena olivaceomarginata]|nr:hypothetical protein B0H14DRAFT_2715767 [Mycena olivaceomarginata]